MTDTKPHGIIPLLHCQVKAVDQIYRALDPVEAPLHIESEYCGPCWKLISSSGRVLLFRSESSSSRDHWIERIVHNSELVDSIDMSKSSMASEVPSLERWEGFAMNEKTLDVVPELSQMIRDAIALVKKQKQEIVQLKSKVKRLTAENLQLRKIGRETEAIRQTERKLTATASLPSFSCLNERDTRQPQLNQESNEIQQKALQIAEIAKKLKLFMVDNEKYVSPICIRCPRLIFGMTF